MPLIRKITQDLIDEFGFSADSKYGYIKFYNEGEVSPFIDLEVISQTTIGFEQTIEVQVRTNEDFELADFEWLVDDPYSSTFLISSGEKTSPGRYVFELTNNTSIVSGGFIEVFVEVGTLEFGYQRQKLTLTIDRDAPTLTSTQTHVDVIDLKELTLELDGTWADEYSNVEYLRVWYERDADGTKRGQVEATLEVGDPDNTWNATLGFEEPYLSVTVFAEIADTAGNVNKITIGEYRIVHEKIRGLIELSDTPNKNNWFNSAVTFSLIDFSQYGTYQYKLWKDSQSEPTEFTEYVDPVPINSTGVWNIKARAVSSIDPTISQEFSTKVQMDLEDPTWATPSVSTIDGFGAVKFDWNSQNIDSFSGDNKIIIRLGSTNTYANSSVVGVVSSELDEWQLNNVEAGSYYVFFDVRSQAGNTAENAYNITDPVTVLDLTPSNLDDELTILQEGEVTIDGKHYVRTIYGLSNRSDTLELTTSSSVDILGIEYQDLSGNWVSVNSPEIDGTSFSAPFSTLGSYKHIIQFDKVDTKGLRVELSSSGTVSYWNVVESLAAETFVGETFEAQRGIKFINTLNSSAITIDAIGIRGWVDTAEPATFSLKLQDGEFFAGFKDWTTPGNEEDDSYMQFDPATGLLVKGTIQADSGYLSTLDVTGTLTMGVDGIITNTNSTFQIDESGYALEMGLSSKSGFSADNVFKFGTIGDVDYGSGITGGIIGSYNAGGTVNRPNARLYLASGYDLSDGSVDGEIVLESPITRILGELIVEGNITYEDDTNVIGELSFGTLGNEHVVRGDDFSRTVLWGGSNTTLASGPSIEIQGRNYDGTIGDGGTTDAGGDIIVTTDFGNNQLFYYNGSEVATKNDIITPLAIDSQTLSPDDVLQYDGTNWVNAALTFQDTYLQSVQPEANTIGEGRYEFYSVPNPTDESPIAAYDFTDSFVSKSLGGTFAGAINITNTLSINSNPFVDINRNVTAADGTFTGTLDFGILGNQTIHRADNDGRIEIWGGNGTSTAAGAGIVIEGRNFDGEGNPPATDAGGDVFVHTNIGQNQRFYYNGTEVATLDDLFPHTLTGVSGSTGNGRILVWKDGEFIDQDPDFSDKRLRGYDYDGSGIYNLHIGTDDYVGTDPANTTTNIISLDIGSNFMPTSGGEFTGSVQFLKAWDDSSLTNNSFYVADSNTGFAFGADASKSTWFAWDSAHATPVKEAINVDHNTANVNVRWNLTIGSAENQVWHQGLTDFIRANDTSRTIFGGGSSVADSSGASIELQGNDYSGVDAGGKLILKAGAIPNGAVEVITAGTDDFTWNTKTVATIDDLGTYYTEGDSPTFNIVTANKYLTAHPTFTNILTLGNVLPDAHDQFKVGMGGTPLMVGDFSAGNIFFPSRNMGVYTTSINSIGSNIRQIDIKGNSTDRGGGLRLYSSDSSLDGVFYMADGEARLGSLSNHPLQFYANNSRVARLHSGGGLSIGSTSMNGYTGLYVDGTVGINGAINQGSITSGFGSIDIGSSSLSAGFTTIESGGTNYPLRVKSTDSVSGISLIDNTTPNDDITLYASGTTFGVRTGGVSGRIIVDASGNIGIGKHPDSFFHIAQSSDNLAGGIEIQSTTNNSAFLYREGGADGSVVFRNNAINILDISGTAVAINSNIELNADGTSSFSGVMDITNTTQATTGGDGALQVAGGGYFADNIVVATQSEFGGKATFKNDIEFTSAIGVIRSDSGHDKAVQILGAGNTANGPSITLHGNSSADANAKNIVISTVDGGHVNVTPNGANAEFQYGGEKVATEDWAIGEFVTEDTNYYISNIAMSGTDMVFSTMNYDIDNEGTANQFTLSLGGTFASASHTHTESDITDLGPYDNYGSWTIEDDAPTTPNSGTITNTDTLKFVGSTDINLSYTDSTKTIEIAFGGSYLSTGDNISALTNDAGYLTSIPSTYLESGDNISELTNDSGYITSAPVQSVNGQTGVVSIDVPSTEDIQDIIGGMVSGNTETNISVTYDDANNELDFVVSIPASYLETGDNVSNLTNDAGYITSIPTTYLESGDNISELTNDSGYITSAPVNSVFGRTGIVSAQSGDYSFTQISGAASYGVSNFNNDAGYLTSHPTITGASADINNTGDTVIQDLSFDTNGHVTGYSSLDLSTIFETKTNLDAIFNGSTAQTGYNKSNWDTAYNWGDHSTQGYITSAPVDSVNGYTGVVNLVHSDLGTITYGDTNFANQNLNTTSSPVFVDVKTSGQVFVGQNYINNSYDLYVSGTAYSTDINYALDHQDTSDERIKDILFEADPLEIANYATLYKYDKRGKLQYGLLAQDMMQYDKDLVGTMFDEEFGELYTLSGYSIASIALSGVKKLEEKKEDKEVVRQLEERVEQLEEKVIALGGTV